MMISSRLVAVSIAAISAGSLVVAGAQVQPPQGQTQGQTLGAGRGNQPARDAQPQQPAVGTGAISGVIVAEGTGTPVRRARVTLSGAEMRSPRSVITNDEGQFGFVALPAGRYTMTASKAGYVNITYGASVREGPERLFSSSTARNSRKPISISREAAWSPESSWTKTASRRPARRCASCAS